MAYQSFGLSRGDSHSLAKLIALRLPILQNKSFLDVGCNTGFFSGYAKYMGAARVLGVDSSLEFIKQAREIFPSCEFLCCDWNEIPKEEFDVILLASALHYSNNPIQTLDMLMTKLAPGGILVLEYGVTDEFGYGFIEVHRPVGDIVMHAQNQAVITFAHSRNYIYEYVGESVTQSGDLIKRHVVHLRKPVCSGILISGEPTSGKSYLARKLQKTFETLIWLDAFLAQSKENLHDLPLSFANLIADLDPTNFWPTYQKIESDLELRNALWESLTRIFPFDSDFIIEGAIGKSTVDKLISEFTARGIKITHIETKSYAKITNYDEANFFALEYNSYLSQADRKEFS